MSKAVSNIAISRRNALVGVATAAAVAPSTALAVCRATSDDIIAPLTDPTFEAIQALEAARKADIEALHAQDDAEEVFRKKYGFYEPSILHKELREILHRNSGGMNYAFGADKIDESVGAMMKWKQTTLTEDELRKFFKDELEKQTAAYEETVRPVIEANQEAAAAVNAAAAALANTVPTTVAGVLAALDYMHQWYDADNPEMFWPIFDEGDIGVFIHSLATGLRAARMSA